ncbi:coiled-coil domain-containing protein R3HCC1L isoform X2 [Jatropha curcas]|uniref:coiled-coil domain-containing protein R3HCC1L isoform X2 n=1 Tax=Jatropha curcas TaxID=180498 RepID=UPI0005FB3CC4|nr:coiled-coil domain-containing protein R3HCC1L isoform X2 [Jatropha curcas]
MEKAEVREEQHNQTWSEEVEDLVTAGDTEGAISLLETLVSKLEALAPSETCDLQLASALTELSKLYSIKHFSLKSDDLLSRASLLRQRALRSRPSGNAEDVKTELTEEKVPKFSAALSCNDAVSDGASMDEHLEESSKPMDDASPCNGASDDDWEAIADWAPNELLFQPSLPSVSNLSLEDNKVQGPKRRGRGTFSYKQDKLYSDRQSYMSFSGDKEDDNLCKSEQMNTKSIHSKYGTRHILVLADFPPSTRTIELEKLFQDYTDHGVVIRWVNDTVALAVFQTPSIALEAQNHVQCPFTVRILDEDDILLGSIPARGLHRTCRLSCNSLTGTTWNKILLHMEPPRRRPQTSTRTAQRLIAQGMGMKLPSRAFGSIELKNQEEARKNRIITRQKMIEDAWGDDEK